MNRIWLERLLRFEREIDDATARFLTESLTGGLAVQEGAWAEDRVARAVAGLLPSRVDVVRRATICDSHDNRAGPVDVVVVLPFGLRAAFGEEEPYIPTDSVSAAIEVKLTYSSQHLTDAVAQLLRIKALRRAGRAVVPATDIPWQRGNVFCGVVFLHRDGRREPKECDWNSVAERIRHRCDSEWQERFGELPDSGRYPNFVWIWGQSFMLKCYARGDFGRARPRPYVWSPTTPFTARSLSGEVPTDEVTYWVTTVTEEQHPLNILALAQHRLTMEANAYIHETTALEEYLS